MSKPGFPKEFGPRDDVGLGKLRALHGVDIPFAKSNPDGTTVVTKANGFDSVRKETPASATRGVLLTYGYTIDHTTRSLWLAGTARGAFVRREVSGIRDSITFGVKNTLIELRVLADAQAIVNGVAQIPIQTYRSKRFAPFSYEISDAMCPIQSAGVSVRYTFYRTAYALLGGASYYKETNGSATEYETVTFSKFDGTDCAFPRVIRSSNGVWSYASNVQGYANHDHVTIFQAQLYPNVHLIAHSVFYKDQFIQLTGRASYPTTADLQVDAATEVPLPLFQVSTDCGRTYQAISMDLFFDRARINDWLAAYPTSTFAQLQPTIPVQHLIALRTLGAQTLIDTTYYSLDIQVPSASPASYTDGADGKFWEVRLFKHAAVDFTAVTTVPIPVGLGTTWGLGRQVRDFGPSLYPAFTATSPAIGLAQFGTMGYVARSLRHDGAGYPISMPDLLMVTTDGGATWLTPRPLPCVGRYGSIVQAISQRELGLAVYEPTTPPQAVLYSSSDLGITWNRGQVIATNIPALGTTPTLPGYAFADFDLLLAITPNDGSIPVQNPMAGWRYDSRIPRLTRR